MWSITRFEFGSHFYDVTDLMKITQDYSRYSDAQEPLLRFVEALVAYAPNRAELERICYPPDRRWHPMRSEET